MLLLFSSFIIFHQFFNHFLSSVYPFITTHPSLFIHQLYPLTHKSSIYPLLTYLHPSSDFFSILLPPIYLPSIHPSTLLLLSQFNMSHRVEHLSFGQDYPGQHNPLDASEVTSQRGLCTCFLVSTIHHSINTQLITQLIHK